MDELQQITPLQFTKDWRNPNDFPTYQTDEAKIREDNQILHDEARDYINNQIVPQLNKATEALNDMAGDNVLNGGTATGMLVADAASQESLTVMQIRNISAGTAGMTPGVTELATGQLYLVYEE